MRQLPATLLMVLTVLCLAPWNALAQTRPCPIATAPDLPFHPAYFTVDPVASTDPPPVPGSYALGSDSDEPYYNGGTKKDSIVVDLNCTYHLYLNLLNSTRTIPGDFAPSADEVNAVNAHYMVVFRVATVPVTVAPVAGTNLYTRFCEQVDTTVTIDADGLVHDNYGGCGTDAYGAYVRRGMYVRAVDAASIEWKAYYQNNMGFESCAECNAAAWVRVYHPDENTWVLAPESLWQAALFKPGPKRSGDLFVNDAAVPFKITVVKVAK